MIGESLLVLGPRVVCALVIIVQASACGLSQYESCRVGASLQQDQFSREMALSRCEQVANREYAESTRQRDIRETREAQRQQAVAKAQARQQRAWNEVRRSPKTPELGATPKEGEAICGQQGGVLQIRPTSSGLGVNHACKVGGSVIYVAYVASNDAVFSLVRTFFEGRDLADTRKRFEENFGPANDVELQDGFRSWHWIRPDAHMYLRGYSRGVAITQRAAAAPALAAKSAASPPIAVDAARLRILDAALQTICNTGAASAQHVLPRHPDSQGMLERGYASCEGAIARWRGEPGGLSAIKNPVEFVCGYAIGAMFAKYGLGREIDGKPSSRAAAAARECIEAVAAQGITEDRLLSQDAAHTQL